MDMKAKSIIIVVLIVALALGALNSYSISELSAAVDSVSIITETSDVESSVLSAGTAAAVVNSKVIPKGIPPIYGQELGISFDDVSATNPQAADLTIAKLGQLDQDISLEGADKERYINILYKMENGISCEYCCGARAIIFESGEPACGCAHSFAMRGLAKYIITKHSTEYTDSEILEEVGKWKTLFFPTQMAQKAQILEAKGIELNYINLASNKYRGIERLAANSGGAGSAGGMVGGC